MRAFSAPSSLRSGSRTTPSGPRWVEAARTELGALATHGIEARRSGFADGPSNGIASAETAFLLAIDSSEKETDEEDRPLPVFVRPAARPSSPIAGDTEPMSGPPPAARPRPSIDAEAVRAILAQPTAILAPSVDPEAVQRIALPAPTPAPRAKSFVLSRRARESSFVGKLGVAVRPPASRPVGTLTAQRVVVVSRSPSARAWNMAAAVLSGLAAAMAVMAVAVSV